MNRQLKFRVWDNQEKILYNEELGNFFEAAISCDGKYFTFNSGKEWLEIGKDVVVQQWTGLTDQDGNDIYEGDIVKYDCGNEWDNETYARLLTSAVTYEGNKYRIRYSADYYMWSRMKILGNIFENPELLNHENN